MYKVRAERIEEVPSKHCVSFRRQGIHKSPAISRKYDVSNNTQKVKHEGAVPYSMHVRVFAYIIRQEDMASSYVNLSLT